MGTPARGGQPARPRGVRKVCLCRCCPQEPKPFLAPKLCNALSCGAVPLVPTSLEVWLKTQMSLRGSLSRSRIPSPSMVHWKGFSWVKLRYVVGEVWRERPKLKKPRIPVGPSSGHSTEFSFLTWKCWTEAGLPLTSSNPGSPQVLVVLLWTREFRSSKFGQVTKEPAISYPAGQ